jgi:HNH endonuclease
LSRTHIPADVRRQVVSRAEGLCEYCLIHESDTHFGCEIDHVVNEKHGGPTVTDNLAYACLPCNRAKGSDIGSTAPDGRLVPLFNPRADRWGDHLHLDDNMRIQPRSGAGSVTVKLLALNADERVRERLALNTEGRYPVAAARLRMRRT